MILHGVTSFVIIAILLVKTSKSECNLKNGQCVYDMKIGQQGQCNTVENSAHGFGGVISGSCTCDDVSRVSNHMNSIKYTESNLQQLMGEMKLHLNNITSELNSTDTKLKTETNSGSSLRHTLHSMEVHLNQTKDQLKNVLKSATTELTGLRNTLGNNTRDLNLCQSALGTAVTTQTETKSDFSTFFCGFQDSTICYFTQDNTDNSDWMKTNVQLSTQTGPKVDHTYGNNHGAYLVLAATTPRSSSRDTTTARLISKTFSPAPNYCIRFWYTMYGKDVKTLNVYAKVNGGLGYPVFTRTGNVDDQWHMAEVSLNKEYTGDRFQIVFEATNSAYHVHTYSGGTYHYVNHGDYGNIALDDVYVYNTTCSNVPSYPAGSISRQHGGHTSYYTFHGNQMSWYDAVMTCKNENVHSNLVTIEDAAEQSFLVNIIQSDVGLTSAGQNGFYTNGNDIDLENNYKWTDTGYPRTINYTNWHPGQPNNVGNNQDCILIQYPESNYEWGDVDCAEKHPFICKTVIQ